MALEAIETGRDCDRALLDSKYPVAANTGAVTESDLRPLLLVVSRPFLPSSSAAL
jgi:hypothetical protein